MIHPLAELPAPSALGLMESVGEEIFPSSVIADFRVTSGVRVRIYFANHSFSFMASSSKIPSTTSIPAARSLAKLAPPTRGLGSGMAATTRAMPAAMSASAQGAVRP